MSGLRVGFIVTPAGDKWIGGLNYTANLIRAIVALPDRKIEPVLIVPESAETIPDIFPEVACIRTNLIAGRGINRLAGEATKRIFGRNILMEAMLKSHGISALSHSPSLGKHSPIPSIAWVPDFQHRRMPEFFTWNELAARDRGMLRAITDATTVVLSSHDAETDLLQFLPRAAEKSAVLHFVSSLGEPVQVPSLGELQEKYSFSGSYFHLPNQFWKHKNHRVAIDAIAELKKRGLSPLVISTGKPHDYRNPKFFDQLSEHVQETGTSDNFKVLGVIPYEDLRGLMFHSTAVINPSWFEGWSTTVEEAKSMGKSVILSNIPVHQEQNPERAIYFDPASATELADAMSKAITEFEAAADEKFRAEAEANLAKRFLAFGRQYEGIVLSAIAKKRGVRNVSK